MNRRVWAALAFILILPAPVCARADTPLDQAYAALEQAWTNCPFTLARAVLVVAPGAAYGVYEPRTTNVFQPGEPIHLYVEPICYGFQAAGDRFRFGMTADFQVLDAAGMVLGGQKDFAQFRFESQRQNREMKIDVNFELTGATPGPYVIETVFHDQGGKGAAAARVEIEVR